MDEVTSLSGNGEHLPHQPRGTSATEGTSGRQASWATQPPAEEGRPQALQTELRELSERATGVADQLDTLLEQDVEQSWPGPSRIHVALDQAAAAAHDLCFSLKSARDALSPEGSSDNI